MDLNYLVNRILPQRKKEIQNGENSATAQPIYVVMDMNHSFISGHDKNGWGGEHMANMLGRSGEFGYIDTSVDPEYREFKEDRVGMKKPSKVTKMYCDRPVAFFLTRRGADDYCKYQRHNLNDPYIYTFYSGYGNKEMNQLLDGE